MLETKAGILGSWSLVAIQLRVVVQQKAEHTPPSHCCCAGQADQGQCGTCQTCQLLLGGANLSGRCTQVTEAWAGFRSMHHLLVTVFPPTQGNIPFKFLYLNPCLAACWCVGSNYGCKKPDCYMRLALRDASARGSLMVSASRAARAERN